MPVVASSAYNTAGQITSLVRSLLNDAAGNLFTDGVLLPYANAAYRKVQRALANVQSGTSLSDDVLLVVPSVAAVDSSVQVSITDATAPPNQLPTDLLVPVKLWERVNGSSDDFVEMTDLTNHGGLPSQAQDVNLEYWEWRADGLYFIGATQDTQIRLRYAKSATLFGREYIAISDGKFGIDIPRQYDGTYFDRVSQVGPGAGPTSVADAAPESPINIAASPSGAVRTSGVATITTSVAHNYLAGQYVTIASVADASFDGVWVIASVPTVTTFTFLQAGTNSTSGDGTATLTPQVSAGVHQLAIFFQTRQGYYTQPSPTISWTAAGGNRVTVTGIPLALGDNNVVARVLAFTASGGDNFYYTTGLNNTPKMVIADNTTTNVTLDFSDTVLLAGASADALFQQVELGECAGVIGYSSRLFWWGERNKLSNFENLTFDGAWSGNTPLGWTTDPTYGAGGLIASSSIWGGCYEIIGDGATFTRGMITQPATVDSDGVPIIAPNTSYSVRARVKAVPPLTQGTLHVQLYSASGGISTTGLQVTTYWPIRVMVLRASAGSGS